MNTRENDQAAGVPAQDSAMKIYSTTQSTLTATMDSCIQNDPWVRTGALGIVGCTVGQSADVRRHKGWTGKAP